MSIIIMLKLCVIFALGFAAIWWLLFRPRPLSKAKPATPLTDIDIKKIEAALGVTLPRPYVSFLQGTRSKNVDAISVLANAELIISLTNEYRAGYCGAPGWPHKYVCIGDESDACPYVLDCETGAVFQADHGDLEKKALQHYSSFREFIRNFS